MNEDDKVALARLHPKLELVRDRVRGVASYLHTGFYLWGKGGTSKSYTVLEELQAQKADSVLHNSRMTGRGLVDVLEDLPESIHVLEDVETLFDDKRAWGVLRSALHSQSKERPMRRTITWGAHRTGIRFSFTGGIIIIANRPPDDIPEIKALKTRIATLELQASFAEVAALMRSVAVKGFSFGMDFLTPAECLTVANHIIERCRDLDRDLDMRVYVNGVKDFLQHKTGHSKTCWQDLIETRLSETTTLRETRADRVTRERDIALELEGLAPKERLAEWKRRTGKSERAFWRRLKGR